MEEGTLKSPSNSKGTVDATVGYGDADPFQWDTREDCQVRQILDRVADKWSLLVIALLDRRRLRFTELRREIDGISQRMLTVTLRQLERDGLVLRTVHPVVPPRVEYELTPLGGTLHHTIQSLVTWTEEHQGEIAAARTAYDERAAAEDAAGLP
ncbi:winged helix-turn-helix transcriptional regulator [Streptomyces flavofungini]|uniref:winged helix-turn-helix transcriptional regulator n=1 Tax=Streptomyces flavofungini TaxID=68200 RepID=UPI0025B20FDB|nr:helix-turn-helix domain-containing protein [Streptomyces flavofungini]WJV46852.1 helix-turn-helix domain-containing protein [Streptomyces flavofungini]